MNFRFDPKFMLIALLVFAGGGNASAKVLELPGIGHDLVVDGSRGQAYVSIPGMNEIDVVALDSLTIARRVVVGSGPRGMDLSADGKTLYIALNNAGSIILLNLSTFQTREIVVGALLGDTRTWDVVEAQPNRVLVSGNPGSSGFSYIVQVRTDRNDQQTKVAGGTIIRAAPIFARSPDGLSVYIGEPGFSPPSLYKLDLSSDVAPISLQGQFGGINNPSYLAVSPDGSRLVTASGQVLRSGSLLQAGVTAAGLPMFSANAQTIYIASLTSTFPQNSVPGTLTAYDATTFLKTGQKALPTPYRSLSAIALAPNGSDYLVLGDDLLSLDAIGIGTPGLANNSPLVATLGQPVNFQVTATNQPATFTASGLPPGLTISSGGLISGTPIVVGGSVVTITATNAAGSSTTTLGVSVVPPTPGRLINISSNSFIPAGGSGTVGFVISGALPRTVLLRAVGPTLASFGVTNALTDPRLQVFNARGASVGTNDNWQVQSNPVAVANAATAAGAFALPVGSKDAALLLTLDVGSYTFQVTNGDGTAGTALLEAYEVNSP